MSECTTPQRQSQSPLCATTRMPGGAISGPGGAGAVLWRRGGGERPLSTGRHRLPPRPGLRLPRRHEGRPLLRLRLRARGWVLWLGWRPAQRGAGLALLPGAVRAPPRRTLGEECWYWR